MVVTAVVLLWVLTDDEADFSDSGKIKRLMRRRVDGESGLS